MVYGVYGAWALDAVDKVASMASTYCSPWIGVLTVVSTYALPRIFQSCRRKKEEPVQNQQVLVNIPSRVGLATVPPRNTFLSFARYYAPTADQGVLVARWAFEEDEKEVYILRTVQRDLVCQVFDKVTGESNRRYIGERGEYSQNEAEGFIRNRVPRLINTQNGVSALFLSVHERILKIWQLTSHEIFLVHNEDGDRVDWVISFINEERVDRVAMGIARELRPWIEVLQRNDPRIEIDARGLVVVNFPNAAPFNAVEPPARQQVAAQPRVVNPLFQELSRDPGSFSINNCYIDNIPAKKATKNGTVTVIGYAQADVFDSDWSYAPLSDGSVLQIAGGAFSTFPHYILTYQWIRTPRMLNDFRWVDQASIVNGVRLYKYGEDRVGRKYFLVPANRGWVPVRHPTDPRCGNWLSTANTTKIIYDAYRIRWPGCLGIDYQKHGFLPQDENNKSWWPVNNGPYKPSFARLKYPCFPENTTLEETESNNWLIARTIIAVAAATYGFHASGMAGAGTLERIGAGLGLAQQSGQIITPLVAREDRQNDQMRARVERERITQRDVLEILEKQDAYNRGEEVVRATSIGQANLVQELLRDGTIPKECRNAALLLAAGFGFAETMKKLLVRADIDEQTLKAARFKAKENNYIAVLEVLKEYNNRERVIQI